MKKFKLGALTLKLLLLMILTACSAQNEKKDLKICPQCKMELPKSKIHTSTLDKNDKVEYFDDIGCMVLWSKDNSIDLQKANTKVFANDTKRYINASQAFYKIDKKTPMLYGFSAYEVDQNNTINFDEVFIRMLRGENMANPKIRKQILGY